MVVNIIISMYNSNLYKVCVRAGLHLEKNLKGGAKVEFILFRGGVQIKLLLAYRLQYMSLISCKCTCTDCICVTTCR